MSVGGIGAMNRTGDWSSSNRADRSRKTSMGHISPSASSQGLLSTSSSATSFGTIDETSKGYGGMSSSSSTSALDYQAQGYTASSQHQSLPNGGHHLNLSMAPGSSAMLDAARTSQSRRR